MVKYLSKEKLKNALDSASSNLRDWMIIKMLSETGLRASELAGLKIKNIDISGNYLLITGKGGKIRNVDISAELANLISLWIQNQGKSSNETLFGIGYHRIYEIIQLHTNNQFTPHNLRHTYAINLLRKTKNIRYVQKQLGHATLSNTQIYLQFMEYDEEKRRLSGLYDD